MMTNSLVSTRPSFSSTFFWTLSTRYDSSFPAKYVNAPLSSTIAKIPQYSFIAYDTGCLLRSPQSDPMMRAIVVSISISSAWGSLPRRMRTVPGEAVRTDDTLRCDAVAAASDAAFSTLLSGALLAFALLLHLRVASRRAAHARRWPTTPGAISFIFRPLTMHWCTELTCGELHCTTALMGLRGNHVTVTGYWETVGKRIQR